MFITVGDLAGTNIYKFIFPLFVFPTILYFIHLEIGIFGVYNRDKSDHNIFRERNEKDVWIKTIHDTNKFYYKIQFINAMLIVLAGAMGPEGNDVS